MSNQFDLYLLVVLSAATSSCNVSEVFTRTGAGACKINCSNVLTVFLSSAYEIDHYIDVIQESGIRIAREPMNKMQPRYEPEIERGSKNM